MHDEIKRFGLTGEVASDRFVSARDVLIKEVEDSMRDDGFVPVLDLLPQFTRAYNAGTETFSFEVSVYGTYIGEEDSWQVSGTMGGIPIKKSIPHRR